MLDMNYVNIWICQHHLDYVTIPQMRLCDYDIL